jgi:hemolysin activation/secretion protein
MGQRIGIGLMRVKLLRWCFLFFVFWCGFNHALAFGDDANSDARDDFSFLEFLDEDFNPWYSRVGIDNFGSDELHPWRQHVLANKVSLFRTGDYFSAKLDTAGFNDYIAAGLFYRTPFIAALWHGEFDASTSRSQYDDGADENIRDRGLGIMLLRTLQDTAQARWQLGIGLRAYAVDDDTAQNDAPQTYRSVEVRLLYDAAARNSETLADIRLSATHADVTAFSEPLDVTLNDGNPLSLQGDVVAQSKSKLPILTWLYAKSGQLPRAPFFMSSTSSTSSLLWEFNFKFDGQYAFAEKLPHVYEMSLGGAEGLRGYGVDTVFADDAWLASFELAGSLSSHPAWRVFVGVDAARVSLHEQTFVLQLNNVSPAVRARLNRSRLGARARRCDATGATVICELNLADQNDTLASVGSGLRYQKNAVSSELALGVALLDYQDKASAGDANVYFNLSYAF